MMIDNHLLDTLSAQAKANPRLRQNNRASEGRGKARFDYAECSRLKRRLNYDLRTTPSAGSQRMLTRWSSEARAKLARAMACKEANEVNRDRGRR